MQIDTNLSHHQNQARVRTIDKTTPSSAPKHADGQAASPNNPSFSRTVLSTSLANVLWEVGGSGKDQNRYSQPHSSSVAREDMRANWVRNAYAENE